MMARRCKGVECWRALFVMCSSLTTSLPQLLAPSEFRGRVLSIYLVAFLGGSPLGSLTSGWLVTRIGTLPHTFGTLLKANGEDVATVQSLMRHANASVTINTYVQAVTPAKHKAQRSILRLMSPDVPTREAEDHASA